MAEIKSTPQFIDRPVASYKDMSDEEFRKFVVDYLYTLYEFTRKAVFEASGETVGVYDNTLERRLKDAMDFWGRDTSNEHYGY